MSPFPLANSQFPNLVILLRHQRLRKEADMAYSQTGSAKGWTNDLHVWDTVNGPCAYLLLSAWALKGIHADSCAQGQTRLLH